MAELPVIYEVSTRVWLNELSGKYAKPVTLAAVPSAEKASDTADHSDGVRGDMAILMLNQLF